MYLHSDKKGYISYLINICSFYSHFSVSLSYIFPSVLMDRLLISIVIDPISLCLFYLSCFVDLYLYLFISVCIVSYLFVTPFAVFRNAFSLFSRPLSASKWLYFYLSKVISYLQHTYTDINIPLYLRCIPHSPYVYISMFEYLTINLSMFISTDVDIDIYRDIYLSIYLSATLSLSLSLPLHQ